MRVPQLNERVKEAPAQALRAVFGGIGSLLFVKDKVRAKAGPGNSTPEAEPAAPVSTVATETSPAAATTAATETTAAPEPTAAPETVPAEATAAPETNAAPETTAASQTSVASEATSAPETTAGLPLPNYDELSVASLRARLRNLTAEQLTQLIGYEKEHANREDVITMFERRITKLNLGLTQALPKVTE